MADGGRSDKVRPLFTMKAVFGKSRRSQLVFDRHEHEDDNAKYDRDTPYLRSQCFTSRVHPVTYTQIEVT